VQNCEVWRECYFILGLQSCGEGMQFYASIVPLQTEATFCRKPLNGIASDQGNSCSKDGLGVFIGEKGRGGP
jgi:hypothetical protein